MRKTPPIRTTMVLKKNEPMCPLSQARVKLSKCSVFGMSDSGRRMTSESSLREDITTQSNG
jgi:hypothetical protein